MLSFPRQGATLALDFPNRGEKTLTLMGRLDAIVREADGALYPAKDGRMPADILGAPIPAGRPSPPRRTPCMNSDFWRRVAE